MLDVYVKAVIHVLWVIFLFFVLVEKVAFFSFTSFIRYFTNWAWTTHLIFYTLTLSLFIDKSYGVCGSRTGTWVIAVCFFPLGTITLFIMTLVSALLLKDPDFLLDVFMYIDPGIVVVGNDIVHVYPFLAWIIFAYFYKQQIEEAMQRLFSCVRGIGKGCQFCTLCYEIVGGSLLGIPYLITLALLGETYNDVYMTDSPVGPLILFYVLIAIPFAGISICVLRQTLYATKQY